MRLTVNLEPDLYGLARSLAREEDCTISAAVNRLLRRSLPGGADRGKYTRRPRTRNGFTVSRGRTVITAGTVRRADLATLDFGLGAQHPDVAEVLPLQP